MTPDWPVRRSSDYPAKWVMNAVLEPLSGAFDGTGRFGMPLLFIKIGSPAADRSPLYMTTMPEIISDRAIRCDQR